MSNLSVSAKFIRKVVNSRERILRMKKSYMNRDRAEKLVSKFKNQVEFYPRLSVKYLRKHASEIKEIIPKNNAGLSLERELEQILTQS